MAKELTRGLFITFEGPEGCGKTTHARRLFKELISDGYDAVFTAEPGGTAFGQKMREILLFTENTGLSNSLAELFLFEADRAQHVDEVIIPALKEHKVVICDRFNTATFAYQGYGLGMDMKEVKAVDDVVTNGVKPDLIILLDIDVDEGLKRVNSLRPVDKMEKRGKAFHEKVRQGYLELAKEESDKFRIVDSGETIETVHELVRKEVYDFIERCAGAA